MIQADFDQAHAEGILEILLSLASSQQTVSEKALTVIKELAKQEAEKLVNHELFDGLAVKDEDMNSFIASCQEKMDEAAADIKEVQKALFLEKDIEAAKAILREGLVADIRYMLYGEYFLSNITFIDGKKYSELYDAYWDDEGKVWKHTDGTPVSMPEPYALVPPDAVLEEYAAKCRANTLKTVEAGLPAATKEEEKGGQKAAETEQAAVVLPFKEKEEKSDE